MSLWRDGLASPVRTPVLHRGLRTPVNEAVSSESVSAGLGRGSSSRANPRRHVLRRFQGRVFFISSSGLSSWNPKTLLRDINAVVRAIERRRASSSDSRDQNSNVLENAELENTTNQDNSDAFITLKKLLASIEKVREDYIKEELRVAAEKAEWDRKMKILKSMR